MKIVATSLSGVFVVETTPFSDQRGSFSRLYCESELSEIVGTRRIVQINHSRTTIAGTIRGLHFQRAPHAETKLVRCLKGRVFDVAIDLRSTSPSFLQWHAEELSPENARMLVIPEGCAHGFQTVKADSELLYLHTSAYAPDAEGGIRFDDPRLAIGWPLPPHDVSQRDRALPLLDATFRGVVV
jgi:dTDP-4-dehydrorhamnose 3,5-epimerase